MSQNIVSLFEFKIFRQILSNNISQKQTTDVTLNTLPFQFYHPSGASKIFISLMSRPKTQHDWDG